MIHYHGTPITPQATLHQLVGRHFCVSFARPDCLPICREIGQSLMLDNGAFSFWRAGAGEVDVPAYAAWCAPILEQRCNWCVIPDSIEGDADTNDELIREWLRESPLGVGRDQAAPVWHPHEPIDRLVELCGEWPRVCVGGSSMYPSIGTPSWHGRMREAMNVLCGDGPAPCWLHLLRGLSLAGSEYPFASADSTLIGQNHAGDNTRGTPAKDVVEMANRVDGRQCAARWHHHDQLTLAP